jgi:hypothetical protein
MHGVFENDRKQWFYSLSDGDRPVGPYVTQEKAQAALDEASKSPPASASSPIMFYDVAVEKVRNATQADWDLLWERAQRFQPKTHYAVRKLHMHSAFVVLLLIAVAVGWELNSLHHPVQLEFCAEGAPSNGTPSPSQ